MTDKVNKLNILGQEYAIRETTEKDDPKMKDNDGYCERYSKEIHIRALDDIEKTPENADRLDIYFNKVKRHEIIHAYLYESGLDCNSDKDWAVNEEIIDWIAIQLPKIVATCKEMGAL